MNVARATALLVASLMLSRVAAAQYRIADALTLADVASGSFSSLSAACGGSGSGGGVVSTIPGLPSLPGQSATPADRAVRVAMSGGAALFNMNAAGLDGNAAGVIALRAHMVPPSWCRVDATLSIHANTAGGLGGTAEGRVRLWPGSPFAPMAEVAFTHANGGMGYGEATFDARYSGRLSAMTPNLYALTLGRLGDGLVGAKWPKLDVRARLYAGVASFTDHRWLRNCVVGSFGGSCRVAEPGGGAYDEYGGTVVLGLLQLPVSLIATSEQIMGDLPISRAPIRDALGIAFRLPGFSRNLWLVTRAERNRDRARTMTYRIELGHLALASR